MLDSRTRVHLRPLHKSQFGAPKFQKRLLSAEWRPLSDGSGSTKRRLEDHQKSLKMRHICGPWTGSLVGPEPAFKLVILFLLLFPHMTWNPHVYSVLYKSPFKMLKFWAQSWSKFQTLKNQFEQQSGRFVVPEPALEMGPRNQANKKNKKGPKMITPQNQMLLSAERSRFGKRSKELLFLMTLGCWPFSSFCGQRPVMTTAQKTL